MWLAKADLDLKLLRRFRAEQRRAALKVRRGETILIDDFTDSVWMTAIGLGHFRSPLGRGVAVVAN